MTETSLLRYPCMRYALHIGFYKSLNIIVPRIIKAILSNSSFTYNTLKYFCETKAANLKLN